MNALPQLRQDVNHRALRRHSIVQEQLVMPLIAMLTRVRRFPVPLVRTATKTELISYRIASHVLQATIALARLLVALRRLYNAQLITIAWVEFTLLIPQ